MYLWSQEFNACAACSLPFMQVARIIVQQNIAVSEVSDQSGYIFRLGNFLRNKKSVASVNKRDMLSNPLIFLAESKFTFGKICAEHINFDAVFPEDFHGLFHRFVCAKRTEVVLREQVLIIGSSSSFSVRAIEVDKEFYFHVFAPFVVVM